mgnify:CR=1 FL=1
MNASVFTPIPAEFASPHTREKWPSVLCFSGYDPSSGAGILADARACAAFETFAVGVLTSVVPQNSCGVTHTFALSGAQIEAQFAALCDDITPAAVKIGLLSSREVISSVARALQALPPVPIILDPVFAPSSGENWGTQTLFEAIKAEILPLVSLVTPNIAEAKILAGGEREIHSVHAMADAARAIHAQTGVANVLVKGGHLFTQSGQRKTDRDEALAIDLFFDGQRETQFRARRLETGITPRNSGENDAARAKNGSGVRGTGCLLASAIAAQMANGVAALDASRLAKIWLFDRISGAQAQGMGQKVAVF